LNCVEQQFEKVNVPPKLFFLTLFWEFVMFFQLSTSFHYSTAKEMLNVRKNRVVGQKMSKRSYFTFLPASQDAGNRIGHGTTILLPFVKSNEI
jgi:hypothetical protein